MPINSDKISGGIYLVDEQLGKRLATCTLGIGEEPLY